MAHPMDNQIFQILPQKFFSNCFYCLHPHFHCCNSDDRLCFCFDNLCLLPILSLFSWQFSMLLPVTVLQDEANGISLLLNNIIEPSILWNKTLLLLTCEGLAVWPHLFLAPSFAALSNRTTKIELSLSTHTPTFSSSTFFNKVFVHDASNFSVEHFLIIWGMISCSSKFSELF